MEMNLSISFLALMICQKSFALFLLLKFHGHIHPQMQVALQTLLNHALYLISVDIYALSNDTICMQIV